MVIALLFHIFVLVCITLREVQSSIDVSDLLGKIRLIEAGDSNAMQSYSTIAETIYQCQIDPTPPNLSLLTTEKASYYARREEDCVVAKFLSQYFQSHHFPLFSANVKPERGAFSFPLEVVEAASSKDRVMKVEVLSSASYTSLFEDFILRLRPFKASCVRCGRASASLTDVDSDVTAWQPNPIYDHFYQLNPDYKQEVQSELVLPAPLSNHYLRRLFPVNPVLSENDAFLHSSCLHSPCLISLPPDPSDVLFYQCPAHAHAVVWPAALSEDERVTLDLFDPVTLAQRHLSSESDEPPLFLHSNLSQHSQDPSSPSLTHFITIRSNDKAKGGLGRETGSLSFTATAQEYAFIPRNLVVRLTRQGGGGGGVVKVFLHCLVDASNLHLFLDHVNAFSPLSAPHRHLSEEIRAFLANDVIASFHHTNAQQHVIFEKTPSELSLETYLTPDIIASSSTGSETAPASEPPKGSTGSNNRKQRRKDFQGWQLSVQWKQLMYAQLLPKPRPIAPPLPTDIDRRHVSLHLRESIFLPVDTDQTKFGFKVVLCALPSTPSATSSSDNDDVRLVHFLNHSFVEHIAGGGAREFRLRHVSQLSPDDRQRCEERVYDDKEGAALNKKMVTLQSKVGESNGGEVEGGATYATLPEREEAEFTLTLRDLHPGTHYQVKVALVYGGNQGAFSDWSPLFQTKPLHPPSPPSAPGHHVSLEEEFSRYKFQDYLIESTRPVIARQSEGVSVIENSRYFGWAKFGVLSADLFFSPPEDDGGVEILGYAVYARVTGKDFPLTWTYKGVFDAHSAEHGNHNARVTIHNLLDSLSYEFKVVAFNEVGDSEYSVRSNAIVIRSPSATSSYHYFALPHPLASSHSRTMTHFHLRLGGAVEASSETKIRDHHDYDMAFEDNVILHVNVQDQTLAVSERQHELWRSHWTKPEVILHAKMYYYAEPLLTSSSSVNPEHLSLLDQLPLSVQRNFSQRVVFLHRSPHHPICHIASTAQWLGAVAVIIVDHEARCTSYSQRCLPGADKRRGEGFAASDMPDHWESVKIPVFFILKEKFDAVLEEVKAVERHLQIEHMQKNSYHSLHSSHTSHSSEL